jgi:hypothetical protein
MSMAQLGTDIVLKLAFLRIELKWVLILSLGLYRMEICKRAKEGTY